VIAWVKENNPKTYIEGQRYDKTKQPAGDPDCKLGCKRKHNQRKKAESIETIPTPTKDARPARNTKADEYYWGYGSGSWQPRSPTGRICPGRTHPDLRPFRRQLLPASHGRYTATPGLQTAFRRFRRCFRCFYVYEYFDPQGGFAAVPFVQRGGQDKNRQFSEDGQPKCPAGLAMHLRYTFWHKATLIPHQRARYACPLLYPEKTAEACPVNDEHWAKRGCVTTIATSIGARLRYQIDRSSEQYKQVLKQRTATERINSQAVDLGIERPKLRNAASIANHNTLTYVLINLHALQRIRQRKAERASSA